MQWSSSLPGRMVRDSEPYSCSNVLRRCPRCVSPGPTPRRACGPVLSWPNHAESEDGAMSPWRRQLGVHHLGTTKPVAEEAEGHPASRREVRAFLGEVPSRLDPFIYFRYSRVPTGCCLALNWCQKETYRASPMSSSHGLLSSSILDTPP